MIFTTEAPDHKNSWKTFCKHNFDLEQVVSMFRQMALGVRYMHENNLCFRDLHPTRIHLVDGVIKWNLIGMPYNFKKLVKNPTFLGHLNYSAPEMILEPNSPVTLKADIWALGCCLYHLATKRDPFMCENPRLSPVKIKQNILQIRLDLPN